MNRARIQRLGLIPLPIAVTRRQAAATTAVVVAVVEAHIAEADLLRAIAPVAAVPPTAEAAEDLAAVVEAQATAEAVLPIVATNKFLAAKIAAQNLQPTFEVLDRGLFLCAGLILLPATLFSLKCFIE